MDEAALEALVAFDWEAKAKLTRDLSFSARLSEDAETRKTKRMPVRGVIIVAETSASGFAAAVGGAW